MQTLLQDLRYGVRILWKSPGFTLIAVLTLALGIGANTALFSVVDALLLRQLPVKAPEELVLFEWEAGRPFRTSGVRGTFIPDYFSPGKRGSSSFRPNLVEKMQEQARKSESPLSEFFFFARMDRLAVVADQQSESAEGQVVSGDYFKGLGLTALLGRTITAADDNPTAPPVAVLSHQYWASRFAANPSVLGKQVTINKIPSTIIGVTPPAFKDTMQVGGKLDITIPMAFAPQLNTEERFLDKADKPAIWWLHVMGRLKPGVTREQARASLNGTFQSLALELMPPPQKEDQPKQLQAQDYPTLIAREGGRGMLEMRKVYAATAYLLFGVVALVLLIACANVANLLLARAASRGAEISVRLAVGAGRGRLLRQLLTESLFLSALGGAVGILFAFWGKDMLTALSTGNGNFFPTDMEYQMNWRVLSFTLLVSLLTGILFGLAPAWRATKLDLTSALKESNRTAGGGTRSRLSKALVVAQVALSLLLLNGAGLAVRTLRNLQQVNVGFDQENLLLFSLESGASGYKDERLMTLYDQIFAQLEGLPGVRAASFARVPLLAHYSFGSSLLLPGEAADSKVEHNTNLQIIRENYFTTMGIPLVRGRSFIAQDDSRAPKVAIVSETLARKFFPNEDPLGKRVGFDKDTLGKIEIVGIVRDIKYNSQREEDEPLFYTPYRQGIGDAGVMYFTLRTVGDPVALVPVVRQAIREVDSNLPLTEIKTQLVQSSETLNEERIFAQLMSFFGLLALVLAALGLYGVMAYAVTQRTREIGIRLALGAQTRDVLRLVLGQGLQLVLIGLSVGAVMGYALQRIAASQSVNALAALKQILASKKLYGVSANDPLTFAVVAVLLLVVALLACWVPARRATKVDPMIALRCE